MSEPGFDASRQEPYQPQPGRNPYRQQEQYPGPHEHPGSRQGPVPQQGTQPQVPRPGTYPYPQQPYAAQPYAAPPYPQDPGKNLRVAGEATVLVTGSVLMVLVGGFSAIFSILFWFGISKPAAGATDTGGVNADTVMASVLFPGPLVAVVLAWIGYAVFSLLKHRVGGLIWFSSVVAAWLLAFAAVMLQVLN